MCLCLCAWSRAACAAVRHECLVSKLLPVLPCAQLLCKGCVSYKFHMQGTAFCIPSAAKLGRVCLVKPNAACCCCCSAAICCIASLCRSCAVLGPRVADLLGERGCFVACWYAQRTCCCACDLFDGRLFKRNSGIDFVAAASAVPNGCLQLLRPSLNLRMSITWFFDLRTYAVDLELCVACVHHPDVCESSQRHRVVVASRVQPVSCFGCLWPACML